MLLDRARASPSEFCHRGLNHRYDGTTGKTAMRLPSADKVCPNVSMNVDLPTPGAPEMPIRMLPPVRGNSRNSNDSAAFWSVARVDSIRVIERAKARRSPARIASATEKLDLTSY